jgi:hypothetical protein
VSWAVFGVQVSLNNKLFTKTLFFFFFGKGETGWGTFSKGCLWPRVQAKLQEL